MNFLKKLAGYVVSFFRDTFAGQIMVRAGEGVVAQLGPALVDQLMGLALAQIPALDRSSLTGDQKRSALTAQLRDAALKAGVEAGTAILQKIIQDALVASQQEVK